MLHAPSRWSRGSGLSPSSPWLALSAAVCFVVAGVATHGLLSRALLIACVVLAALSLTTDLRRIPTAPWQELRRRRR